MALTNAKRKLDESSHNNESYKQPRKWRHSDHAPLSSISNQVAKQPGNRHARVDKATKPKQAFEYNSDSSADEVPVAILSEVGTRKGIDQKQKVSRSKATSLDHSDVSAADSTRVDRSITSEVLPSATLGRYSEDAVSEGEGIGAGMDVEDDEDKEEVEYDDEDDPTSALSSEGSPASPSDASTNSDTESDPDTTEQKELHKADNPTAFASSMAGILSYKLTTTQRSNPILARSAAAKEAHSTLLDQKLEKKAKAEMKKEERRHEGAGDPLLVVVEGQEVVANQQHEKELRKMAQRGVVKMFNAFNSVRERALEAQRMGGSKAKKEERATEMSKEGWLEFVGQGGKGKV